MVKMMVKITLFCAAGVNLVWNRGVVNLQVKDFEAGRLGPGFRPQPFGPWHRKRWQLSFQLLVYQGITLINPNTIRGVIIFISRTYMYIKQEFVIFMIPTSISVIRHHFHQQNSYLIRILCMLLDPSSVIGLLWFISIIPLPLSI